MKNAEWMIKNGYEFSSLHALPADKGKHGYDICIRTEKGWFAKLGEVDTVFNNSATAVFFWLDQEHKEPILGDEEREYLAAVIRPFRDRVEFISKVVMDYQGGYTDCYICIRFTDSSNDMSFPVFCETDMYKGMKLYEKYTLEELGL